MGVQHCDGAQPRREVRSLFFFGTSTPLEMPASTEEERSRTLEIEDPTTPAPEIAERPAAKLANKAAAAANKLRPKTHTRLKEDDEDARVAPPCCCSWVRARGMRGWSAR